MAFRNYSNGELIISYWSNAKPPFCYLSNFTFIEGGIEYDGIIYPSVEHAFQAQKYIKEQRIRFSINGDLGTWDGLRLIYKSNEYEKKFKYWSKKKNIGIIAKMATNEKIGKNLGLIIEKNFNSTMDLWIKLLEKKFSLEYFNKLLKSTNDLYILHFDRVGNFNRKESFWGGVINNNILLGNNEMGKYLMEIRNRIK